MLILHVRFVSIVPRWLYPPPPEPVLPLEEWHKLTYLVFDKHESIDLIVNFIEYCCSHIIKPSILPSYFLLVIFCLIHFTSVSDSWNILSHIFRSSRSTSRRWMIHCCWITDDSKTTETADSFWNRTSWDHASLPSTATDFFHTTRRISWLCESLVVTFCRRKLATAQQVSWTHMSWWMFFEMIQSMLNQNKLFCQCIVFRDHWYN